MKHTNAKIMIAEETSVLSPFVAAWWQPLIAWAYSLTLQSFQILLKCISNKCSKPDSIRVAYRRDGCIGPRLLLAPNMALCKLHYNECKLSHIHFPSSSTYNLVFF